MYKRMLSLFFVAVMVLGLFVGCGNKDNDDMNGDKDVQLGELEYETVDSKTVKDKSLKQWIEENSKKEGVFTSEVYDNNVYILLGAGEQNTGGYSVEVTSVIGKEDAIEINGKLNAPKEEDSVITAITYPYTLISVKKDNRKIELGDFEKTNKDEASGEKKNEAGVYVGQIDSNSIEIAINNKTNAYWLNEDVKGYFEPGNDSYRTIKEGDSVQFSYYQDKGTGQLIITEIHRTNEEGSIEDIVIGAYKGLIDNNSVEISVDGETMAYRLTDQGKAYLEEETIYVGDIVSFTYNENDNGQRVITDIRKEPGYYLNK